jgi:signal recognition particle subunit SRP68
MKFRIKKKPCFTNCSTLPQDPDLPRGKSALVNFPPDFQPIPCKPLFYDLAVNHLEMPSLETKLGGGRGADAGGQKAGLSGWIWGWGKK